jgi:hypothetical protein
LQKLFLTEQKQPIEFTYVPKPKVPKVKVIKVAKSKKGIVV